MRVSTARNAENNKNVTLKYANRTSNEPSVSDYGDEYYTYEEPCCLEACVMPFKSSVEAKAYGVSLVGGRKITLTLEEGSLFNEFTHIWIEAEPSDEGEYYVKNVIPALNSCLLIIERKDGHNE